MTRPYHPAMKRALGASLSLLVASSLLLGGATALAQSPSPGPVLDVEWTLSQLDGDAVPADPPITATFSDTGLRLLEEVLAADAEALGQRCGTDGALDFVDEHVPGGSLERLGQA